MLKSKYKPSSDHSRDTNVLPMLPSNKLKSKSCPYLTSSSKVSQSQFRVFNSEARPESSTSSLLVFKKESSLVLRVYKYTSSVHFQRTGRGGGGGLWGEHLTCRELTLWRECRPHPRFYWYVSVVSQCEEVVLERS